ncbi:hypothetical protein N7534_008523 [Penicillium rubens]|nr:hypothetical protein N7534_008523 [Penicillium rubens]
MHKLRISGVVLKGFSLFSSEPRVAKYYANAVNQDPHAPGLFTNPVNTGRSQPGLDRNPEESRFYSEEVASPNASC